MGFRRGKIIGLAAAAVLAISPPLVSAADGLLIDSLSELYQGVDFDHDMHIEVLEEDCSQCHHHTVGVATKNPACVSCHRQAVEVEDPTCGSCHAAEPFTAAEMSRTEGIPHINHRIKPGLKAAYHLNCMGCHQQMGGPVGCQDCHAMTDAGEKYYHTGAHAPKPGAGSGHGH